MNRIFNIWTPAQWIDWEEMSLCQWAPYHGRDELRDESQIASVSPLFISPSLVGTLVCFGLQAGFVCFLFFKIFRSLANYCIVLFTSLRDSLTNYALSSIGCRGKKWLVSENKLVAHIVVVSWNHFPSWFSQLMLSSSDAAEAVIISLKDTSRSWIFAQQG